MASMVKLHGWQTWNSMCGKHGLANWAGQFFPIGQHHPVVRMSLWARYKAPRCVLDIFNPVRSISSSPWTLSRMENGIWSPESKVNPQILIRAGLTTDGGKGSSSPTGMSVVGCHPPNKSRIAFFLPALRLASFDFPGCHHWTIPESPSTSTTWPMTKGSAFESFKVMTKSPTQHEASMAGSESPTVPSCTKLSRGIPGMSAPSKGWESKMTNKHETLLYRYTCTWNKHGGKQNYTAWHALAVAWQTCNMWHKTLIPEVSGTDIAINGMHWPTHTPS